MTDPHLYPDPDNECSYCGYGINGNMAHHKNCPVGREEKKADQKEPTIETNHLIM